ncbi:MAG: patatin-like phospholipase family protein [Dehalococcoidales bacterium]|nr:patatin-like phospholipase family protein [Dehalococcoidales bacterium]
MSGQLRRKVGLALSGGAARGIAHIGVLEVLEEAGIPIDVVAGVSAGAIVGALYAAGRSPAEMAERTVIAGSKRLSPFIEASFSRSGLIRGKKIMGILADFLGGDIRFDELRIPFACVATDIDSGEEIVIDHGSVLEAIRASISIPGIFTVVRHEGRFLVDGGLTTPVPVSVVRQMGAEFVIAVNVNPDITLRRGKTIRERKSAGKEPSILQVMLQSIYITTYTITHSSLAGADIVIEPDVAHLGAGDFHRALDFITCGREAARKALPEIKKKLEKG